MQSIPDQGAKIPHAAQPKNPNRKQKQYCNKFNRDFKNGPHQKKNYKNKTKKPPNVPCTSHLYVHGQSLQTLCDPMNCSSRGSSVHGILQARAVEWGALPCSRGSSQSRDRTCLSCISGGFFSPGATAEVPHQYTPLLFFKCPLSPLDVNYKS